jgi:hypothetical protein
MKTYAEVYAGSIYAQEARARYMKKKYWPYQYAFPVTHNCIDIDRWCCQQFKGRHWRSMHGTYVFKREKDYTLFLLRWAL